MKPAKVRQLALILITVLFATGLASAAVPRHAAKKGEISRKLTTIRSQVKVVEQDLVDGLARRRSTQGQISKIRVLIDLQKKERVVALRRLTDLETVIKELEDRKVGLKERLGYSKRKMRLRLKELERAAFEDPGDEAASELERLEAPRQRTLKRLVDHRLKELEAYRVDLADAQSLETRIADEKQKLGYFVAELREKESVLELNRQLQADMLTRTYDDRLNRLQEYRKLKSSENDLESLLDQFNARMELQETVEAERSQSLALNLPSFSLMKGKLFPPVMGRLVSNYGQAFDPATKLQIFRKGIEIDAGRAMDVKSVTDGRVAFSGVLPRYGKITIIEHGDHYYTLCAKLGEVAVKEGETIVKGQSIGRTDDSGTPVYFEIRSRNIAINPLDWLESKVFHEQQT